MTEPQIIKLKKEITLLNQYNFELKNQIQEQSIEIGELKTKINSLSQNSIQKTINTNTDIFQRILENEKIKQKEILNEYKNSNSILSNKINYYEQTLKENESLIQKLQIENNELKKNLIQFSQKHEAQNYISQMKSQNNLIIKKNEDYTNLVRDWDLLCEQMDNVLSENRLLRQMANVPENFGIDIAKIKMGDKIKIEDYKTKIRLLIHEVDELETERAKLKRNMYFLGSSLQLDEKPFNLLSKEQKVDVAYYAQNLYEGKNNDISKIKKLENLLEEKNNYINKLESELRKKNNVNNIVNNRYYEYDNNDDNTNEKNSKDFKEIITLLKDQGNDLKKLVSINEKVNKPNVVNIHQYNNFFIQRNLSMPKIKRK